MTGDHTKKKGSSPETGEQRKRKMTRILPKPEYELELAKTRDHRMEWFRKGRFGMFVHYGLYSILGRMEWAQCIECIPPEEYQELAKQWKPREGICREWAMQAKAAGMKYMVMTTRHHEGFSLWNSKVNPFNSYNVCGRDIVQEFVDACREFDLKIGFYSSLMDWHHPDGYTCAYDNEARRRFLDYIEALNVELLSNYGKIDMLWYDVACPMQNWEGWDSLARNQRLRELQPDIVINNRSLLPEDVGTPEGHLGAEAGDWEACMTFNDISWGYVDEKQVAPYSYTAQRILRMLRTVGASGGNLLLNVGPKADGSVPEDVKKPLNEVGQWLRNNGEALYNTDRISKYGNVGNDCSAICSCTVAPGGRTIYFWNWIWPHGGEIFFGGFGTAPKSVELLDGTKLEFEHKGYRTIIRGLPEECPDPQGVAVFKFTFDEDPKYMEKSYYPQFTNGWDRIPGLHL